MSQEKMEMPTSKDFEGKSEQELLALIEESQNELKETEKELTNLDQQEEFLIKERAKLGENVENIPEGGFRAGGEELPDLKNKKIEEAKESILQKAKIALDKKAEERVNVNLGKIGLGPEQIKAIPGWETLTEGQRMLVLNRYQNFYVENIKANAEVEFEKRFTKASGFKKLFMNFGRTNRTRKIERELLQKMTAGGLNESKKAHLETLVSDTLEHDFKVSIENGKIAVNFANTPEDINTLTKEQLNAFNNYNIATTELMQIPEEWGGPRATKAQRMKFENAKNFREESEKTLLEVKNKLYGSERAIVEMNRSRAQADLVRFDLANPTIGKAIDDIKKTSWKDLVSRRDLFYGGLFFLGAGLRNLGVTAPISGGVLGGFRGWLKGKEKLYKQDKMSRRGQLTDLTEAKSWIKGSTKDTTIQDIGSLTSKINSLIERIEKESQAENKDPKKIQELTRMLESRIEYSEMKMDEARVNHGNDITRLQNRSKFVQALTQARGVVSVYNPSEEQKVYIGNVAGRVMEFEAMKDQKISKKRAVYLTERVLAGAVKGATVAFAGQQTGKLIAGWFDHSGEAIGTGETPEGSGDGNNWFDKPDDITKGEPINEWAIVHKGDSPESLFIKQIDHRPELAKALGYTGDMNDTQALHKFAGRQAHLIAMDQGYFKDIHNQVGPNALGINRAAYQLEIDGNGKVFVHEYFDGKSVEMHTSETPFETDREKYEFLHDMDKNRDGVLDGRGGRRILGDEEVIPAKKPDDYFNNEEVGKTVQGTGEETISLKKPTTTGEETVVLKEQPGGNTGSEGTTFDEEDPIQKRARLENRANQKEYIPAPPRIYHPGVPNPFNILFDIFGIGRRR